MSNPQTFRKTNKYKKKYKAKASNYNATKYDRVQDKRIVHLNRKVMSLTNELEVKYATYQQAAVGISGAWTNVNPTHCLSGLGRGVADGERVGREFTIISLMMRGTIEIPEQTASIVATKSQEELRMVLFIDLDTNGTAATGAEMFDPTGFNIYQFKNLTENRFRVILDKRFLINRQFAPDRNTNQANAVDSYVTAQSKLPFEIYYNFKKPLKILASGTTNAFADYQQSSIQILATSSNANATIDYTWRIRYRDA